jgi:hypothetical protein
MVAAHWPSGDSNKAGLFMRRRSLRNYKQPRGIVAFRPSAPNGNDAGCPALASTASRRLLSWVNSVSRGRKRANGLNEAVDKSDAAGPRHQMLIGTCREAVPRLPSMPRALSSVRSRKEKLRLICDTGYHQNEGHGNIDPR